MKIRTNFPHPVTILENVWIPLADGARLAAKIWLPDSAHQQPVPALLEYIPYRKSDYTSGRDAKRQPPLYHTAGRHDGCHAREPPP